MRSLFLPARRGRLVQHVGLAILAATYALSVAVVPALAHDDDVSGPADIIITIGSGLSDRDVGAWVGDIVRFVNRDDQRHRMRSRSGPEFDTGDLEPGESGQVRLSAAGTYSYVDERDRDAAAYRGRIVVGSASGSASRASGSAGGTTGGTTGGAAGGTTGGSAATSATVTIGDDFYQPTSVRITAGGTVTFQNTGGDEHSATSSAFDTGVLGGGSSVAKTFEDAGTFDFLCIFHSDMRGTIQVVAAASGAAAPEAPRATPRPAATPVPAPTAEPTPQLVGAPADVRVDAADFEFRPATIDVVAGGRVTWTNAGVAPHTVTAVDDTFDSGMLEAGATFIQRFETPGSYAYLCAVHPEMTATVRVVAPTTGSGDGGTAPAAAAGGTNAGPSATQPEPAPIADAAAPTAVAATDTDPAVGAKAASDVSDLAGIVVAVTLVSVAAALFAKAIRATVRMPG